MREEIDNLIKNREEIPLFYIESGSRLLGIQNCNSDYDVRGFHLQSKKQYFDFKKHPEIIEFKDDKIDFVSYDIDKMFGLLLKSNASTFEQIRAQNIYFNQFPDWSNFQREIIENINYKTLFYNYLSLAKGNIKKMEANTDFTHKTTFYCIHGLLSAELSSKKIIPELLANDLFNQFEKEIDIIKIGKECIEQKGLKREKDNVNDDDKTKILSIINAFLIKLEISQEINNDQAKLEDILSSYSFTLKDHFYV